jgi:hypothetical protein
MRAYLAIVLALGLPQVPLFAQTNSLDSFVNSVNAAWQQTNHTQVVQLVNQRLNANGSDVVALCVLADYRVFVDGDVTNAWALADQFNSVIQQGSNTNAKAVSQALKDEIQGIPSSESGSRSQSQINSLHNMFPVSFPGIDKCRWLAMKAGAAP